jgi:hypothetical protein
MTRTTSSHLAGDSDHVARNAERYETSSLPAFNFGEVVNLSATGMRIRRPGRPITTVGSVEKFVIAAGAAPLVLRGRVVWSRRSALLSRTHELGVQFLNVDKSMSDRLVHIGQFGFDAGDPAEANPDAKHNRRILASIEVEDLYEILGVSPETGPDDISRAYRLLVRRWHPDVCKEAGAGEQMVRISKAYRILRDHDLRRRYDEMRAATTVRPSSTGGLRTAA